MLVLQRKKTQSVIIGGNIKISIMDIGTDKVKIAIDAPKEISIIRAELLDAADTNREAVSISNASVAKLQNLLIQHHKKEEEEKK